MPFSLFAGTKYDKATFAGGCFWCTEHPFENLKSGRYFLFTFQKNFILDKSELISNKWSLMWIPLLI
ncbi:MAG: peptide-methionine (S)-S-oxide reductase [Candidatus Scalindua rubra]|nr:peptide-methionine (S)-S-oxide reductase [Candidatus Scalindua rubra]